MKLEEFLLDIKKDFKERTGNRFIGAYFISFMIFNRVLFYFLFNPSNIIFDQNHHSFLIDKPDLTFDWWNPIGASILYLILVHPLSIGVHYVQSCFIIHRKEITIKQNMEIENYRLELKAEADESKAKSAKADATESKAIEDEVNSIKELNIPGTTTGLIALNKLYKEDVGTILKEIINNKTRKFSRTKLSSSIILNKEKMIHTYLYHLLKDELIKQSDDKREYLNITKAGEYFYNRIIKIPLQKTEPDLSPELSLKSETKKHLKSNELIHSVIFTGIDLNEKNIPKDKITDICMLIILRMLNDFPASINKIYEFVNNDYDFLFFTGIAQNLLTLNYVRYVEEKYLMTDFSNNLDELFCLTVEGLDQMPRISERIKTYHYSPAGSSNRISELEINNLILNILKKSDNMTPTEIAKELGIKLGPLIFSSLANLTYNKAIYLKADKYTYIEQRDLPNFIRPTDPNKLSKLLYDKLSFRKSDEDEWVTKNRIKNMMNAYRANESDPEYILPLIDNIIDDLIGSGRLDMKIIDQEPVYKLSNLGFQTVKDHMKKTNK